MLSMQSRISRSISATALCPFETRQRNGQTNGRERQRRIDRRVVCNAASGSIESSAETEIVEAQEFQSSVVVRVPKAQPVSRKKRSRRYKGLVQNKVEEELDPKEALRRLKDMATAKFDETVELHGRTCLDPRYADQQLRATGRFL